MRIRKYKIGYNKDIVVVKGPIDHFIQLWYDDVSGMTILAALDDKEPIVEYGIIGWPAGKEIDDDHIIKTDSWNYFGRQNDGRGRSWDYYISRPIRTFTKDEVDELFKIYFAPLLNNSALGEKILEDFYNRESIQDFNNV